MITTEGWIVIVFFFALICASGVYLAQKSHERDKRVDLCEAMGGFATPVIGKDGFLCIRTDVLIQEPATPLGRP